MEHSDIIMTLKYFFSNPVNLTFKTQCLTALVAFLAILITAWFTRELSSTSQLILVASMGASSVLLFIVPNSPLSQPWQFIGGQLVSALSGVLSADFVADKVWAAGLAAGLSVFLMLVLRCLHPPGAATALTPVLAPTPSNYDFILYPVAINVLIFFIMAVVLNRFILKTQYPLMPKKETEKDIQLKQVLKDMDTFTDVSLDDLNKLLILAEKHKFKEHNANVTCADIMVENILTVEYGTEVEDAWHIMLDNKLKALPVLDKSRRIIGIITWADFFKFIDLNNQKTFQDKFLDFIRRTPDVSTNKPEAVGHIMTNKVITISDTAHIIELIPLMSNQDIRQIPIVNAEQRLVGMVYQTHLIAALYNAQLA